MTRRRALPPLVDVDASDAHGAFGTPAAAEASVRERLAVVVAIIDGTPAEAWIPLAGAGWRATTRHGVAIATTGRAGRSIRLLGDDGLHAWRVVVADDGESTRSAPPLLRRIRAACALVDAAIGAHDPEWTDVAEWTAIAAAAMRTAGELPVRILFPSPFGDPATVEHVHHDGSVHASGAFDPAMLPPAVSVDHSPGTTTMERVVADPRHLDDPGPVATLRLLARLDALRASSGARR